MSTSNPYLVEAATCEARLFSAIRRIRIISGRVTDHKTWSDAGRAEIYRRLETLRDQVEQLRQQRCQLQQLASQWECQHAPKVSPKCRLWLLLQHMQGHAI